MELDYLLATAMFLIVCVYVISETVNLHSVYDIEEAKKRVFNVL